MLGGTNMATARNFDVSCNKFNLTGIRNNGNYAHN